MLGRTVLGLFTACLMAMGAPAAAAGPKHDVVIRAASLSAALHDLARQTRTDLLFDEASVRGLSAPPVRGRLTVDGALQRLLRGSGLTARRTASGAFVIERRTVAPPVPEDVPEDLPVPDILVVGKRTQNVDIRRRQDDVQPYQVSTGREIVRSHRDNLDQYFRSRVTQNTQVLPPSLLDEGDTSSRIDLRGLGPDGTLILLDGRRLPSIPSAAAALGFQQPDINAVPLHAIDRVETLTGTAGGIYGFGALGGVVNVVLRRDYSGLDLHATAGISARGDTPRFAFEGRFGYSPNGGRTGLMVFLSHARTDPLLVGERGYVLRDQEESRRLAPERIPVEGLTAFNSISVSSFTGEALVFKPEYGGAALASTYTFLPTGFAGTRADLVQALASRAGQVDFTVPESHASSELGSSPHATAVMVNLRHRFSSEVEAFAEAILLRNRGRHIDHEEDGLLFLFPDSPVNPFEQVVQLRFPIEGRSVEQRTTVTTRRYTSGLVASLPRGWRGTAEATFGSASRAYRSSNERYYSGPLFLFGGEGGPEFNPFGSWEAFQAAAAAPEFRPSAFHEIRRRNRYREQSLRLAGPLFELAGGPATLTVLAERRQEKVPLSIRSQRSEFGDFESEIAPVSSRTASYYAELRAPLGSASAKLPLLRKLELQLAARHDDLKASFSRDSASTDPEGVMRPRFRETAFTAGAKVSPWPWLMLRGSYATGAQPPPLGDLIALEGMSNLLFLADPRRGNSILSEAGAYLEKSGGSPDLKPVRAGTLSLGAVLTPLGEQGPILSVDYSRIRRIAATIWPERETVGDSSQGVPLATMQKLARYWATDYDWRAAESKLNALPQFVTEIDGLDIHFIHVRSKHPDALPLVISHGWPGSVLEQIKLIAPLTDPLPHGGKAEDAFHLVIPSMPGYGFSGKPTGTGWGPEKMARAWAELMKRLGYSRYVAQGGDWGAFVVDRMALQAPPGLLAVHTNMPATVPADVDRALLAGAPPPDGLSAEERRAFDQLVRTFKQVDYARLMGSRPQTLYGIADSPVGLAAWLLDHNDADGQPAAAGASALDRLGSATGELTRDEILDNITLYWLTNTGVSSSRLYWEYKGGFFNAKGVKTPVAVTVFPGEQYEAPRSWTERAYPNLIYYNRAPKGGHFAAWEQPQIFAEELRAAFKALR